MLLLSGSESFVGGRHRSFSRLRKKCMMRRGEKARDEKGHWKGGYDIERTHELIK